jgi:hypothetical protein
MSIAFPTISIGAPLQYEALSVFPLFAAPRISIDYLLSDEAIQAGSLTVEEVSEGGSVPELLVENKGDIRILFVEGEELIGAKQNRVLNTSVLIAAKSKTKIPVSCVEQGRWRYRSRHFGSHGTHSPSKLRYLLKSSVSRSVCATGAHISDQGGVWREVARQCRALQTDSDTGAMSDMFADRRDRIAEFQDKLTYIDGAIGAAVAVGRRVVAVDVFDKPATCRKMWSRLLSGFVLDALEASSEAAQSSAADVEQILKTVSDMPWQQVEPVGEGEEYRAESGDEMHASALTYQETPLHLSAAMPP